MITPLVVPQVVKSMAITNTFTGHIDNLPQHPIDKPYKAYLPIIKAPVAFPDIPAIDSIVIATATPFPTATPHPTITPIPPASPWNRTANYPVPSLLDNINRWIAPKSHPSTYIPYPTPDGTKRSAKIPILMYHYLSVPPEDADIYRQDLSVSPGLFVEHLNLLWSEGYQTISLYELLNHLTIGSPLPERSVVMTFDDGYRDNYEYAFPLLLRWGMNATFFIVNDFIDNESPRYVTWDMVRTMYTAGMSIEAHSRNHASLKNSNVPFLGWQARSLERIEEEIGVRPRFIAYPAGEYDNLTISVFHNSNYWGGATTRPGSDHRGDSLFELRRVRVRGTTTAADLKNLLEFYSGQ